MALTSGNVTIKLAGGDYSSWKDFWNDLGNLTGNITCTVDASAFTETLTPLTTDVELNGHTIHVLPVTFPTKTDASDGARFTFDDDPWGNAAITLSLEGPGTVIIEGMVLIAGTMATPTHCFATSTTSLAAYTLVIRRNIVKEWDRSFYQGDSGLLDYRVYNNIFFDQVLSSCRFIYDAPSAIFANNTIVHSGDDSVHAGDEEIIFKNNISYGATDKCWDNIEILTEGYNNASSDTTGENGDFGGGGSGNLSSIVDPFNDLASDDFTITAEGVIGKAGLDLSGDFTTDFFGVVRSNWTIGACEFVEAPELDDVGVFMGANF